MESENYINDTKEAGGILLKQYNCLVPIIKEVDDKIILI